MTGRVSMGPGTRLEHLAESHGVVHSTCQPRRVVDCCEPSRGATMTTTQPPRRTGVRRATSSVLIALDGGIAAVVHTPVGGAAPAATVPSTATSVVSTAATDPTSTTTSPASTTSSTTIPAGSCIDDSGHTVGTLPGQTSCPPYLPPGECQAVDPTDCDTVPEVRGLADSADSSASGRSASLRFTG